MSVHQEVSCHHCNMEPLIGIRYKCSTCLDFSLCSQCIDIFDGSPSTVHFPAHVFFRISRPVNQHSPLLLHNRSEWKHHLPCNSCSTLIQGFRYFCTTCALSFCEACEISCVHRKDHNLLKMAPPNIQLGTKGHREDSDPMDAVDTRDPRDPSYYTVPPLPADSPLPSAEIMTLMLRKEEELRLSPTTQKAYAEASMSRHYGRTYVTINHELQLSVVREFGFSDSYVNILRAALSLYSREEVPMSAFPFYVRFNRSKRGDLTKGSKAPDVPLALLSTPSSGDSDTLPYSNETLHSFVDSAPCNTLVIVSGSFT